MRILPDRSVADFFVSGGQWAATQAWVDKDNARNSTDSTVLVWSSSGSPGSVSADIDVWAMGCGWVTPSYTENPTM